MFAGIAYFSALGAKPMRAKIVKINAEIAERLTAVHAQLLVVIAAMSPV